MSPFARLDLLRLGRFWRVGGRDPVLLGAVAILALIAALAAGRALTLVADLGPMRLLLYGGLGATAFAACWPAAGSRYRRALERGPLQPWTLDRKLFLRWLLIRSASLFGIVVLLVAALALATRPAEAAPLAIAMVVGGVLSGGALRSREHAPRRVRSVVAPPKIDAEPSAARARARAWRVLLVAALRSRGAVTFRGLEALALLALTSAVAGLAARNNDSPAAGLAVSLVGALLASAVLGRSNPRLTRLLGVEPVSLPGLWWLVHGPLSLISGAGGVVCAGAAGLGWLNGAGVGLCVGLVHMGLGGLQLLHGLGRSPRLARTALAADMICGATFLGLFGSWTIPLAGLRFYGLVRAARQRRWNG